MTLESRNEARLRARLRALREALEVSTNKLVTALIEDDIREVERAIAMYDALRLPKWVFRVGLVTRFDDAECSDVEVRARTFDEAVIELCSLLPEDRHTVQLRYFEV